MFKYVTKTLNIPLSADEEVVKGKIAKSLNIKRADVASYRLRRQSVDARDKSNVHFACSYVAETPKKLDFPLYEEPLNVLDSNCVKVKGNFAVIGAGPAGLFAALYLAKCGVSVTLFERGSDIAERRRKAEDFWRGKDLDEECNVQFGLGGAGTFSDGKLTSGISSSLTYSVFSQFVKSGAPSSILTSSLPHIGSDNLFAVVSCIRDELIDLGVNILFDTKVADFAIEDGKVTGVIASDGKSEKLYNFDGVILACGHSSRDMFHTLVKHGSDVRFKPFAVGLRIEHSREFINTAQYGKIYATHRDLGSASYKLVNQCSNGKGCYSFCMCPGGVVVPASSQRNGVVVNGMSNYARNDVNSNSAIVVTVNNDDVARFGFGNDSLAGLRFQEYLERRTFEMGGSDYSAPCQNVSDFINGCISDKFDVNPSYSRGVVSANLRSLFPEEINDALSESFAIFDKKIKGFGSCGVLTAVESRTSSPVRIMRGADYQNNLKNLYPIGEGAGYAGGIVSSAVDGLKVAMSIVNKINR